MDAEAGAGKKLVTVGFMRRFDAAYNEMKAVLDSGEHGRALLVHNRHRNPSVPESYTSRMAIDDTAIHEFDTMRWLLGEEIVRVRVERPRSTTHRFDHLIDPVVVVAYTESGVRIDDEVNVKRRKAVSLRLGGSSDRGEGPDDSTQRHFLRLLTRPFIAGGKGPPGLLHLLERAVHNVRTQNARPASRQVQGKSGRSARSEEKGTSPRYGMAMAFGSFHNGFHALQSGCA